MHITVKRIHNVQNWLTTLNSGSTFRVKHDGDGAYLRKRIGLEADAPNNSSILPSIVGAISRFNSEGKWTSQKHLPKEFRYVRTVRWTWTTFDGIENTDFKDVFRFCYQREFTEPPAAELEFRDVAGKCSVLSPELMNTPFNAPKNLHVINLMLEMFGSCEIVQSNLSTLPVPILKNANWRMLPSGSHPFEKIEEHVKQAVKHFSDGTCSVILDRQKTLKEFGPEEMWVGEGGFDDYIAYVFNSFNLVVLESVKRGNAIYVFADNWQTVSKLTKAEILKSNLQHSRIIHVDGWKNKLALLLVKKAA